MASAVRIFAVNQIVAAFAKALCASREPGFSACCFSSASISSCDKKREVFQIANDVAVVGVDPELVKFIDACSFRVEPDGAGFGFAEFCAVGVRDERQRQAESRFAQFFADKINAGGDIAPLIAAADLQFASELLRKAPKNRTPEAACS